MRDRIITFDSEMSPAQVDALAEALVRQRMNMPAPPLASRGGKSEFTRQYAFFEQNRQELRRTRAATRTHKRHKLKGLRP